MGYTLARYLREFVRPCGYRDTYPFPAESLVKGPRVLDLGAGYTSLACRAQGFEVTTVEHDPEFLNVFCEYAESIGYGGGEWMLADEWRMMLAEPYDTVILDHGPTQQTRIDDLDHALQFVGGQLLIDDWRGAYRKAMHGALYDRLWHVEIAFQDHPRYVARAVPISERGVL